MPEDEIGGYAQCDNAGSTRDVHGEGVERCFSKNWLDLCEGLVVFSYLRFEIFLAYWAVL